MQEGNEPNIKAMYQQLSSVNWNYYIYKYYAYAQNCYDALLYNKYLGFSEDNKGMPIHYEDPTKSWVTVQYMTEAPRHMAANYQEIKAMNFIEVFFGQRKPMNQIVRTTIKNVDEGFYGFYHSNYQNIFYLPDYLSTFIQLQLNQPDAAVLELYHNTLYDFLIFYTAMWNFRILLSWYLYINIYTVPWSYLASGLDWMEECFGGAAPSFLGASSIGVLIGIVLGKMTDALNHVVFTMPYLPSEGEHWIRPTLEYDYSIDQTIYEQLVKYHYFPRLWYFNGIPDKVRMDWFENNPFYLEYYYKLYGLYQIQVLPNYVLDEFPEWKDVTNLNSEIIDQIISLPKAARTVEFLHEIFHPQLTSEVISTVETISISLVPESSNISFSFMNLINPDLIVLQNTLIQENKLIFHVGFVQQYFEPFWKECIYNLF
jgi:hypothetical protein